MTVFLGCAGLYVLLDPNAVGMTVLLFLAFVGANLIAVGQYLMIRHLYRVISRSEPDSDRPLRGTPLYLLGQLGGIMTVTVLLFLVALPELARGRLNVRDALWGIAPAWVVAVGFGLVFVAGLLVMLSDLYLRFREVERIRSAQHGRPLDEDDELPGPGRSRPGQHAHGIEPVEMRRPREH
jgi:hypothetical protein